MPLPKCHNQTSVDATNVATSPTLEGVVKECQSRAVDYMPLSTCDSSSIANCATSAKRPGNVRLTEEFKKEHRCLLRQSEYEGCSNYGNSAVAFRTEGAGLKSDLSANVAALGVTLDRNDTAFDHFPKTRELRVSDHNGSTVSRAQYLYSEGIKSVTKAHLEPSLTLQDETPLSRTSAAYRNSGIYDASLPRIDVMDQHAGVLDALGEIAGNSSIRGLTRPAGKNDVISGALDEVKV